MLGLFPMALGWGEGAEVRAPMAVAVMGGLFFSIVARPAAWFLGVSTDVVVRLFGVPPGATHEDVSPEECSKRHRQRLLLMVKRDML